MPGAKPLSAVLLSALLLFAIPCRGKDKEPEWIEVHSPHFSVVSDAGDRRARDVALRFEQMYFVFGTLFSKQTVNFPVPLQIIAFRNTGELRNFVPLWKGKPIQLAGLYQGGQDRNFILLDLSVEDPYQVVFHEYGHLLLNGNYPPTQLWFDEGFAQYFSTIQVMAKENKVQIGLAPQGAFEMLRSNSFFHTVDLFNVKHDSKAYNESGDHRSMFYGLSWLYVHYLFDNKKLDQVAAYFNLTQNQHVPVAEAVQQLLHVAAPPDGDQRPGHGRHPKIPNQGCHQGQSDKRGQGGKQPHARPSRPMRIPLGRRNPASAIPASLGRNRGRSRSGSNSRMRLSCSAQHSSTNPRNVNPSRNTLACVAEKSLPSFVRRPRRTVERRRPIARR